MLDIGVLCQEKITDAVGAFCPLCVNRERDVTIGVLAILAVLWRSLKKDHYSNEKHFGIEAAELYWHFVDVIWIVLFLLLYLL